MAGNGTSTSGLGDVRNLLGFLVAGFAGVLNVLGLKLVGGCHWKPAT